MDGACLVRDWTYVARWKRTINKQSDNRLRVCKQHARRCALCRVRTAQIIKDNSFMLKVAVRKWDTWHFALGTHPDMPAGRQRFHVRHRSQQSAQGAAPPPALAPPPSADSLCSVQ